MRLALKPSQRRHERRDVDRAPARRTASALPAVPHYLGTLVSCAHAVTPMLRILAPATPDCH